MNHRGTELPWQRIDVAGERVLVLLDPDNRSGTTLADLIAPSTSVSGEDPQTVVRAMKSEHTEQGQRALAEDPAALWWCEASTVHGEPLGTTVGGVLALVDALIRWRVLDITDRREAIPVATDDGIRDVLLGRAGYAVDLGRWRLTHDARDLTTVQIGSAQTRVQLDDSPEAFTHVHTACHAGAPEASAMLSATTSLAEVRVERGIAHGRVNNIGCEHSTFGGNALAAAATALVLRHRSTRDAPHHWSVQQQDSSVGVRMFATEEGEHVSVSAAAELIAPVNQP